MQEQADEAPPGEALLPEEPEDIASVDQVVQAEDTPTIDVTVRNLRKI